MGVVEKDDQAKACYEILKQNSLPSLQEFISQQPDDEKVFQSLASAMTNLSVRNIRLSMEVSLFVRWKLSDYAYRQLSGDWPMGELDDWKAHIAVISGCWRDIIAQTYHDNDSVDDRLLHRLRMIHNHLYFIQFKKFLADLPVWEIVFCVAIFINTYVEPNNYRFYRLMISKRMLMEWLGAFVPALERVQDELEQMEPVIRTIASDEDGCRFHPLIDDLISQLQASTINNKEFIVGNFRKKRESAQGSKVELAKEVLKKLKRQENYDAMKDRLKALESSCGRIARIKEELERIVHPKNVYDQMMAGLKQKTPTDTIVNKIIADAEFSFTDLLQPEVMASIRQCYRQMKQFYSLVKIHECISIITKLEPTNNKEHFVACVKRILTVMGEAINNTKNTPNMPDTRVHAAVQRMLTYQFKDINIWHRNTLTHDLSRNRTEVTVEREWMLLKLLPKHMRIVGVTLELLLIAISAIIRHSFYGMLARSPTLESLRALLIQVDEEDIFREAADDWWEDVNTYYRSASELLDQESRNPVGQTSQFQEAALAFNHQKSIVEQLKRMALQEETFNYESVWKTCFASNDLSTVKHLLLRKLNSYNPSDVLDEMSNAWDANIPALSHIAWENRQLLQLNPTMAATCILTLQNELIKADHYVYAELTKELIAKLGGTIAGDELQQLTTKLVPYYKNLFRLDLKRDVLEKFCQSRNLPFDRANLREQDQRELQQMFDDRRARLRSLFEQCGIHTTEDLSARLLQVPSDVIVAMEYVQVELCEMLLAVQYFGDNFPALKHSIPMIQGKSFRNYLAHDALSYDILTCSGKEKCVINAFIFAHTPVSLFDKRTVTVPPIRFPSLEDTKQWIEQQLDLRDAVVAGDESRMNAGGEMMGQYYDSLDTRLCRTRRHSITDFVNWSDQFHPNVAALLSRYFADFEATFHDRNRRMNNALDRRDFEKAYELYKDLNFPNEINVRKSLLAWPGLPADFIEQMVSQYEWQPVLRTLIDYGNEQGAQLVIMSDRFITPQTSSRLLNAIVRHAIERGLLQSARLVFSKMCCPLERDTVELAIVVHWNELLMHDATKPALNDENNMERFTHAAVTVSNYWAMQHFFDHNTNRTKRLSECYLAAASCRNYGVLEKLFQHYPLEDASLLTEPLYRAVVKQDWECARLLLDKNACADVFFPSMGSVRSCALLQLVQHGMVDLIRCIKRIDLERWYDDPSTEHPFAVAIEHEQESKEMYEVLESLGFDCFDNPTLLQTTIMEGSDHFLWNVVWTRMDENFSRSFEMYPDPFRLLMKVLHRWRWIAFVEKPYDGDTALSSAVKADNTLKVLDELINRARTMRTLEGDGLVLGDVAICSTIGPTRIVPNGYLELGQIYKLFTRYEYQTELQWQAVPLIEIGKLSIKFLVLDATMFNLDAVSHLEMRDTAALADNLLDLQTISNALFGQCATVHATVAMGARTLHFWRIQDWCCAYDTLQYHAERPVDLSNMVNTRLAHGRTVLYQAIKYGCEIDSIQLLLEIGANALLADEYGATAIVAAIERTQDPDFAVYLLNACAANDYRNEVGDSLAEMIGEPGDRGLLDYAEAFGHQKVVQFLNNW